jgi:predicted anti-sigma-YlaC factor YlaD
MTHLLSESQDRKLSIPEKVQIEMHLAMCRGCRNFKEQMQFLRQACKKYFASSKTDTKDRKA